MAVKFVAYIDESGDPGIQSVRPVDTVGATEWLVLSCFLVRIEDDGNVREWVREIRAKFKNAQSPHLHFSDLNPAKKRTACNHLAAKPCALFVVMSNKKNIRRYNNPRLDEKNRYWLYWFLARLLLERVTDYCERRVDPARRGQQKVRIVFSKRGRLNYAEFAEYLQKIRRQSRAKMLVLDQGDIRWTMIDLDEVFVRDHKDWPGLQLADIVAGAFFQSVERDRPAECDSTYAKLLKPKMAQSEHRNVLGFGIKCMPELNAMGLSPEQREVFEFYGYTRSGWQPPS